MIYEKYDILIYEVPHIKLRFVIKYRNKIYLLSSTKIILIGSKKCYSLLIIMDSFSSSLYIL